MLAFNAVAAGPSSQGVISGAAQQDVVTGAAVEPVSNEGVIADLVAARDMVVSCTSEKPV